MSFYYYGARYLNPKTSMWISSDPALESYLPVAPTSEEARKHNGNLPGMGGVFNPVNLVAYHYAGNNPLRMVDPNGCADEKLRISSEEYLRLLFPDPEDPTLKVVLFCREYLPDYARSQDQIISIFQSVGLYPSAARTAIKTPYGDAFQSTATDALQARSKVEGGALLYRIGTTGKSMAGEAQFWALENPLSPGFAEKYGVPPENIAKANFIEIATLKPGTPFITRPAPAFGSNAGGGIEVVVPSGGVELKTFISIP